MKIVLNEFENWVSDDLAKLNFGSKTSTIFPVLEPPHEVMAAEPLAYFPNTGDRLGNSRMDIESLEYVRTIPGAVRKRPNRESYSNYTTEHQSFHIYNYQHRLQIAPELVVCVVNGGGNYWMWFRYGCDKPDSIRKVAEQLPNDIAWDILDTIYDSYRNGIANGSQLTAKNYAQAFVDGRLKKRKQRGQDAYTVNIVETVKKRNQKHVV